MPDRSEPSTAPAPARPPDLARRRALTLFGGFGLAVVGAACGSTAEDASTTTSTAPDETTTTATSSSSPTSTAAATTTTAAASASCDTIPEETAGPYPGDGSNGVNVLDDAGVVRSDITSSFGSSTTTAEGIPLTIQLTVVDTANGCVPMAGAAVYLWHCDREGRYSLYSDGVTGENYLRGVQVADADGNLTFTSIFPACYDGRWPHAHFEVYPDVDSITNASNKIATSQLAFPKATCDEVYATEGYEASVSTLARVSLTTDMVFRDGVSQETPTISGSATSGYTATLRVPV